MNKINKLNLLTEEEIVNVLRKSDIGRWHISQFAEEEKHYASLSLEDIAREIVKAQKEKMG